MKKETLVTLSNVSLSVSEKTILNNISFDVFRGEILTIIGPNGAGKSTLIKVILGLVKHTSGLIQKSPNLKIGYMPQKIALDQTLPLTVKRFIKAGKSVTAESILNILTRVNASHLIEKSMHVLSGGELQKVLLANAIINDPDLLIMDEPAQALDVVGQQHFYELVAEIRATLNCGIILISHDLRHVMAASDHILCMNVHICCSGKPAQVSADPSYISLFGEGDKILASYQHTHDHKHDEVCE